LRSILRHGQCRHFKIYASYPKLEYRWQQRASASVPARPRRRVDGTSAFFLRAGVSEDASFKSNQEEPPSEVRVINERASSLAYSQHDAAIYLMTSGRRQFVSLIHKDECLTVHRRCLPYL